MKINFSSIGFDASETLNSKIEEKLRKLGKQYSWVQEANVHLKINKNDKDKDKLIEIQLIVPGNDIYVHKSEEKWDLAIRDSFQALNQQMKKHKKRDFSHPTNTPLKS